MEDVVIMKQRAKEERKNGESDERQRKRGETEKERIER
jgi:hypothetical protein